jgi:predicted nucleic acid-binding Zn ribbon protein
MLETQPNTTAKVSFAWSIAAGRALARSGTPVWSGDGTLFVRARTEAWRKELRRAKPQLLQRLRHLLGADVVRRIEVS